MSAFDPEAIVAPTPGGPQPGPDTEADPYKAVVAEMKAPAPVQPQAPPSEYGSIVADMKAERDRETDIQARMLEWRAKSDKADPGVRADVLRYSAATGQAPEFVERNLEAVKAKADAEGVDWGQVAYRQPALTKWLTENPNALPLAKDDTEHLGRIEWSLSKVPEAFWDATVQTFDTNLRMGLEFAGMGSAANRREIDRLNAEHAGKDYGAEGWIEKGLTGGAAMLPMLMGDITARYLGALGGAALLGGAAAPTVVGEVPAVATGAVGGAFAGSLAFNALQAYGPLYARLSQVRDANGNRLDPTTVRLMTLAGGTAQAGLMAGVLGKLGGSMPAVKRLMESVGARGVEAALAQQGTLRAVGSFAKRYGETVATGAALMAAQSAVGAAAEEGAKGLGGPGFHADLGNVGTAFGHGLRTGFEDTWLLAALGPGHEFLHDIGRAQRSAENHAKLEVMSGSAEGSKLAERDPVRFKQAVEEMAAKGEVKNVYVPIEQWTDYWTKQKVDPGEMAAAIIGDGGKAFSEAQTGKGDLAIPIADYLAKMVRTEHAEGLRPDTRLYQEDLTPREAKLEDKRREAKFKAEAERRKPELEEGQKEVYDLIHDQARQAGMREAVAEANATLISEFARTMAVRLGVPVRQAALVSGVLGRLRIHGPEGVAAEKGIRTSLEQPAFHGSPHVFDKFTTQKIGSGEGNQAYGWGLYFAQRKGIAEHYREMLAGVEVGDVMVGGKSVQDNMRGLDGLVFHGLRHAAQRLRTTDTERVVREARYELLGQRGMYDDWANDRGGSGFGADWMARSLRKTQALDEQLAILARWEKEGLTLSGKKGGAIYKVEVPEDADLLALDEPLGRQSEAVRELAKAVGVGEEQAGRDLYSRLTDMLGSPPDASRALLAAGVPGLRYLDEPSRHPGVENKTHNYVIWDDSSILNTSRLEQGPHLVERRGPGGPRAEIAMKLDWKGKPVQFDIGILRGDESTLAHELGHFLSWGMHDLAEGSLGTAELKADYETLIRFAGYESPAERLALSKERADLDEALAGGKGTDAQRERRRVLHAKEERISHAFEQYLATGKAPSAPLRRAFRLFKQWMKKLYNGLPGIARQYREKYGEELVVSDEVHRVFDRLLATDAALEAAGRDLTEDPAALEGMTPAEQTRYREAIEKVKAEADEDTARKVAEIERERVGEGRARIRAEVTAEMDKDKTRRAQRYLTAGEWVDDRGVVRTGNAIPEPLRAGHRLNRKATVKQYGPEATATLGSAYFDPKKDGGVKPDDLAWALGFEDGADMLAKLKAAGPRSEAIKAEVQKRMDAEYGDALQLIREAAFDAAHTHEAALATAMEIRALAKTLDPGVARRVNSMTPANIVRFYTQRAVALIGEKAVQDLDPGVHLRLEKQAREKAAALWASGDKEGSLDHREARLLHQILYVEAKARKAEVAKARTTLRKTTEEMRADLGKAEPEYRNLHDQILGAVGMGPKTTGNIDAALTRARADGEDVYFDVEQLRARLEKPKQWDRLTVSEALNVRDAVVNLREMARHRNRLDVIAKGEAADAWFADVERHLVEHGTLPPRPLDRAHESFNLARSADAVLADAFTLAHLLDNGDRNGPVHRLMVDAEHEARNHSLDLAERIAGPLDKAWRAMPEEVRKLRDTRVDLSFLPIPEAHRADFAAPDRRSHVWMIFLMSGNEGTKRWMREGLGWGDAERQQALDMLTPHEAEFLQSVLDIIGSLRPDLEKVNEARTGLPLKLVAAEPITVNGVKHAGGYFPARPDRRFHDPGAKTAIENNSDFKQVNYFTGVAAPHRIARKEGSVEIPDLSWGVVPAHITQVIHDIAYGDYVREAGRLILDPRFNKLVSRHLGPEYAERFRPWLKDVANQRADSSAGDVSMFQKGLTSWARRGLSMAVLGANLPNQLQGLLDAWRAPLEGVSMGRIAVNYVKLMRPGSWHDFQPFEDMRQLRHRSPIVLENLRRTFLEVDPSRPRNALIEAAEHVAFWGYQFTDSFTTRVTARSAYEQARAEGFSHEEACAKADDVVARLYPTHNVAERAALLRSKNGLGAMLVFHTWANKNYNILRRMAPGMNRKEAVAYIAARVMFYGLIGAGSTYFIGRGPEQDEDKRAWLLRRMLLEPLATLPVVSWGAENLVPKRVGGEWKAGGGEINIRAAPEAAFAQDTLNRVVRLMRKDDKTSAEQALLLVEMLAGGAALATGAVPAGQIDRTGRYLQGLVDRQQRPRGALDVASGLTAGPPKKNAPANPLTDLQALLSER